MALFTAPFAARADAVGAGATQLASAAPMRGYLVERDGAVTWTYPAAARGEVGELRSALRHLWPQLATDFGAYLEPSLDIRVALNPEDMQRLAPQGRRLPTYASGVAFPADGVVLLSLTAPDSWLRPDMERLLAHELSHVALHRAVGGAATPRWFTEGLAVVHSGEHSLERVRTLWGASLRGGLIALKDLDDSFSAHHGEVDLAYSESADLVGAMLEGDEGATRARALCAKLRAAEPFDAAFASAYGESLSAFEQDWRLRVAQRFGRWPSILSGLTAVWGAAALLLVVGYVRIRRRQRATLERWAREETPLKEARPMQAAATSDAPAAPEVVQTSAPRHAADTVLDAWLDQHRMDGGVPTIVHEGRSYTLH